MHWPKQGSYPVGYRENDWPKQGSYKNPCWVQREQLTQAGFSHKTLGYIWNDWPKRGSCTRPCWIQRFLYQTRSFLSQSPRFIFLLRIVLILLIQVCMKHRYLTWTFSFYSITFVCKFDPKAIWHVSFLFSFNSFFCKFLSQKIMHYSK